MRYASGQVASGRWQDNQLVEADPASDAAAPDVPEAAGEAPDMPAEGGQGAAQP